MVLKNNEKFKTKKLYYLKSVTDTSSNIEGEWVKPALKPSQSSNSRERDKRVLAFDSRKESKTSSEKKHSSYDYQNDSFQNLSFRHKYAREYFSQRFK